VLKDKDPGIRRGIRFHRIYTFPAEDLPLVPEIGKLDLAACFAMFNIREPAVLWK
jgi:hypothetical protein